MDRLIIVARNDRFPRASARPASGASSQPSHTPARRSNYEAGLSSGRTPVAAAGGTRQPSVLSKEASGSYLELEAHFACTAVSMFVAGCLSVALLTLVLL